MKVKNFLTIDVEDYFQVGNFQKVIKYSDWDNYESRVVGNTDEILSVLDSKRVKATFFILGWIAERFPEIVKRIHNQGHEVASHGYSHKLIYMQGPQNFREDIKKSKAILEDIIGELILGYRAPCYSITKKSVWALNILMEEGFKYDSSLFPIRHDKGGLLEAKRYPYKIYNHEKCLQEMPLSTFRLLNQNIPFSGGGYFRLLPYSLIKGVVNDINKQGHPVVFYIHPWELDPEQPKIKAGFLNNFRHYVNIPKTKDKISKLLDDFEFKLMRDTL